MRITGATIVAGLWMAVMIASVIMAGWVMWKNGVKGLGRALLTVLGGLMMFAFVSAVIGLYEMPPYYDTFGFWVSLGIGAAGAWLFGRTCCLLRSRNTTP